MLEHIAGRPTRLARAVAEPRSEHPSAWWDPVRPLEGRGDWLEGVRIRGDIPLEKPARQLFEAANDEKDGALAVVMQRVTSDRIRSIVIEAIADVVARRRWRDPALSAWIERERAQAERLAALRFGAAERRHCLRRFRLQLYPYQEAALEQFLRSGRMLLADDMGLGKTVQAAAIGHTLVSGGKIDKALVLAPASLKSQWVREWRRATHVPIEIVEGSPSDRRRRYEETRQGVLVANYEQVFRDLDLMQAWAPELVVLDEAQRIKNWGTQTAGLVKQLDVPFRLVLTGTPLENRLEELSSIMDWVDPFALAPKWRLSAAHSVFADGGSEVTGMRRLDVLRTRLAPRMLRRRRQEILPDLPDRTDSVRCVPMTEAQRGEHDELNLPIARLAHAARRRPLTQPEFLRLMSLLTTQRVVANGLAQLNYASIWPALRGLPPDEATISSLAMPKLTELRSLIESIVVDQGRKVVVFSQWRRALSLAGWTVRDLLSGIGARAAFFTGAESQKRRTQNVIDFHDDSDLRVLFCTDAGGVGLNLQRAASACVQFELPWNPAVYEQRVARLHRLGQPDPVDVYTLVSDGSIEERIAASISDKRTMFSGVFDGETDEVQFERSGGFMAAVQATLELPRVSGPRDEADPDPDAGEPEEDQHVDRLVTAADEHDKRDERNAAPESPSPRELPDAREVAELFAELRVAPRPDGGLHIEASPRAARTLGALLAGMASLLVEVSGATEQ